MSTMKLQLDKIINDFNERLFSMEMALMANHRTMSLILKKLDLILVNDVERALLIIEGKGTYDIDDDEEYDD